MQDSSSLSAFRQIADYGMLADCHSAAHVDVNGAIDWLCLPHYDSSALFSRILDPDAGHWSLRPAEPFTSTCRYLPGTLVLETTFTTDSGVVRLTDAMSSRRAPSTG
ncbi:MAG: trehalase-like domain-containing protein, partial [Solirubrobacterales bacterium]